VDSDRPRIIAISGPVCAGKSTLAQAVAEARGASVLTTRLLIAAHLNRAADELSRAELQQAGDLLDRERGGAWVAEGVLELGMGAGGLAIVDAVRNAEQLAALRLEADTLHVHLSSDESTLAQRYNERSRLNPQLEFAGFEDLRANRTEAEVERLGALADLRIDTSELDAEEAERVVRRVLDQRDMGEGAAPPASKPPD
jgi:adenylosuccinate synthase